MKTYDLVILCEDGFGLEVLDIAQAMLWYFDKIHEQSWFRIKGFICPRDMKFDKNRLPFPVLGTIEDYQPAKTDLFAMGILSPVRKEWAAAIIRGRGGYFPPLWAPWVLAPTSMVFPEGCVIAAQSVRENAKLGEFVTLFHSMVANGSVGAYSSIMAFANVTSANIGRRTYIGANSAIMIHLEVGDDCYVYPNSVIVKNVKSNSVIAGIPARKVRGDQF